MNKESRLIEFKYRLGHCLTKRRMGDYLEALKDLDMLFDELIADQIRAEKGSKAWEKLTRMMV